MSDTPHKQPLRFGDLVPDTRTPVQKRADSVAEAIGELLSDPNMRDDIGEWQAVLRSRHALPEAELRGFDAMLRRELITHVNAHASKLEPPTSAKSFIIALPLKKTTSAAIFEEMAWWQPSPKDPERAAQIDWLRTQLQCGALAPRPRPAPPRPEAEPAEQETYVWVTVITLGAVLLFLYVFFSTTVPWDRLR